VGRSDRKEEADMKVLAAVAAIVTSLALVTHA